MRLIDADKLPKYTGYALSADEVAMAVINAPTVDPVKHGHWIEEGYSMWCSECGGVWDNIWNFTYCPNCGACMMED